VPNELEWEWAAKGAEDWTYPTGNVEPNPRLINADDFEMERPEHRLAVDQLIVDQRGTFGLAGNVMEWTTSVWLEYDDPLYATMSWRNGPSQTTEPNQLVVARGGSWAGTLAQARSTSRYPIDPKSPADYVGLRCIEGEGTIGKEGR
jgi:formylglycine-generating enzyme